LSIQRTANA